MTKKWSLMMRLMVFVNLVSVIIIVGLSVFSAKDSMERTTNQIKNEMETLGNTIKLTSSEYVWNLNSEGLKNISQQLIPNEAIEGVYFHDAKNVELAKAEDKDEDMKTGKKHEELKLPIIYGPDKQTIGFVTMKYNLDAVENLKKNMIKKTVIIVLVAQAFMLFIIWLLLKRTTNSLSTIASNLRVVSEQTKDSSESVRAISEEVSSATTEQAASIQETVSTLDEITSMVNTSVESAQNSAKKAEDSHSIANSGKDVVRNMISSMEEIDESNKNIMDEISKSNERIAGIVKVIDEISKKTTVINDIVFQTKLLSFNASVEAARAGEHGKGFAVVAEEVGNLAQMSGKASNEISQMLQESIKKVNDIITETNRNVQRLIEEGNSKVKKGVEIADQCGRVLDEVVDNAAVVKTMMNEVSVASKEQAEGVKNISQAMNQLDQTTHSNANAANRSFQNSKELSQQAEKLKQSVEDLEKEIFGGQVKVVKSQEKSNVIPLKRDTKSNVKTVETKTSKPEMTKSEIPAAKKEMSKASDSQLKEVEPVKAAVNEKKSNLAIPSSNDPRFEDV